MTTKTTAIDNAESGSEMTIEEMAESLDGFEEIAIEKHFDRDISDLLENKPTTAMRALIFVEKVRAGITAPDAKKAAMELRLKQAMGWYAEAEFEADPDAPESESGKDEPQPSGAPGS